VGKRLDDLHLKDGEILPADARNTEWYRFLQEIEDLLPDRQWAADTLEGIQETVERTHRVTQGQKDAVRNIRDAEGRGSHRRYEGHPWRRGR
jgi:hypothetical protein